MDDDLHEELMTLLRAYAPLPLTSEDFMQVLGKPKQTRAALRELVAQGVVKSKPNPESSKSQLYYLEA